MFLHYIKNIKLNIYKDFNYVSFLEISREEMFVHKYVSKWEYKNQFIVVAITTFVFVILYHSAVMGSNTNMFIDIGADSINLSYPKLYLNARISQGYILNNGLGQYMPGTWFTMLQPFNLVRLIVRDIIIANLISLYMEYVVTAVFAYLFLKKLVTNAFVAILGSLLWTYSGYMVLWGQQGFIMPLTYFTCAMFFFQCLLNKEKKGVFVVVPLAILAINSYYFFYMTGLFMVLYTIGYSIVRNYSFWEGIKKLLTLLGIGVISTGMGAVGLFPALRTFMVSARTSVSEQKMQGFLHDAKYMFSVLGRILSNDIFGVGNSYTGYYNYYESAVLVCSALFIPCLVIMIRNQLYRRQTIVLLLVSVIALCTPVTSYIFNFDSRKPRWTYMLIVLMVLCIVYCIDAILADKMHISKVDICIIIIVYFVFFCVLMWGDRAGIADVKRAPFIMAVLFTICYIVAIKYLKSKQVFLVLVSLVVVELISSNYASVNNRTCITRQMLDEGLYNDGTENILEDISDSELYRVNKTYDSVFYNDAMVQGYNGLAVYNPTNSRWLVDYYQSLGYELLNGKIHYVRIKTTESIYNTLMGVKYIVAKKGDDVPDNYTLINSIGDKMLYYNEQSLGFGYMYRKCISKSQYKDSSIDDRAKILTNYYYLTDDINGKCRELVNINNLDINKSINTLKTDSAYDVSINGSTLTLSIEKNDKDIQMLCIPIVYDSNWHADVDGKKEDIKNINGGLIGIEMSESGIGKHSVTLYYDAKEYKYGAVVSIVSTILFLTFYCFIFRRKYGYICTGKGISIREYLISIDSNY